MVEVVSSLDGNGREILVPRKREMELVVVSLSL